MVRKLASVIAVFVAAGPLVAQTPADSTTVLQATADYLVAARPDLDLAGAHPAEGGIQSYCMMADPRFPTARLDAFADRIRERIALPASRCAGFESLMVPVGDSIFGYSDVEGRHTHVVTVRLGSPSNSDGPTGFSVTIGILTTQRSSWGVNCTFSYDVAGDLSLDRCRVLDG